MERRGQQEIAGFVIMVVLVVVALLVFLAISVKKQDNAVSSELVSGLLSSVLRQTTECIIRDPTPANIQELIVDVHSGGKMQDCGNGREKGEYLEEFLPIVLERANKINTAFSAWQISVLDSNDEVVSGGVYFNKICESGKPGKSERVSIGNDLKVEMYLCLDVYD